MALWVSWLLFPLVLSALGCGWGALVQRASGVRIGGALLLPVGLAAALVVAGTLTAFTATARAAVPVVAVGAAVGLAIAARGLLSGDWRNGARAARWPALAAVGVLLAYGAPVLLSGHATFTGFVTLDDTATWFNVIDHVMSHARSVSGEPASTYSLVYSGDVGPTYPLGSFVLPGVGRALVDTDIVWVFQPYMACCAAALALCLFALLQPLIASPRIKALAAFVGAQPALLYGYSMWGGIKEMTAAFLLALGVALTASLWPRPLPRWRELVPLALAAGALIQTLGVGAAGWVLPALLVIGGAWLWRERHTLGLRTRFAPIARLAALTAGCVVPVWVVLSGFFSNEGNTLNQLFSSGQSSAVKLGNLIHPLSIFQLAGIWPVGDFRLTAPTVPSVLLIGIATVLGLAVVRTELRQRQPAVLLYVAVALVGCAVLYLAGATQWVVGKALAISSPALLVAGLAGGAMLWSRWRSRPRLAVGGTLLTVAVAGGVLWSNALAYHDTTLAPRPQLADLEHIGTLVAGKGPTFVNSYEVYADRHFLRAGAPVEPAEYRTQTLALRTGAALTKAAAADIDSFSLSTLQPYRSIVTRRSPVESRPPSIYSLVWQGRYYELWQRPAQPTDAILQHIPLGESNTLPYCGQAEGEPFRPLCSIDPAATPACSHIVAIAGTAARAHAALLAYQRPEPIVARGDQTLWPGRWIHDPGERSLTPTTPGQAVSHIAVANAERYELWLGGSFTRGFDVSVDGRHVGRVKDELVSIGGYVHVADAFLTPGVHTFGLTYPNADLTPGSGENGLTSLNAIALEPTNTPAELIRVTPTEAVKLCGRPLDWIEIVT
jgi:hypothetical protein